MSVVNILERVTAWVQEEICPQISLKVPPDNEAAATDEGYEWETVHPTAFPLFVPTKDKLPPLVRSPFPSICVRFSDGVDDMKSDSGAMNVELYFSTWSTGTHGKDVLIPANDGSGAFHKLNEEEAAAYFRRTSDGWRDVWNMIDIALREIESTTSIRGLLIDRSVPVKYGPLKEQEAIPDFYPFWFAWASFTVTYPIVRNVKSGVSEFL